MKKRIIASALALALALSLAPAAFAAGGFSDVTDAATARNVEVLRLMGVIGGDGDGMFRPYGKLTRAEFCKMAIELQGRGDYAVRYRSRAIFPDVRTSHWAAGYINLASTPEDKTPGLMHGFPDGTFLPDKSISYGEAVTVLARVLGYTDKDSGGVWPQGYLDLGASAGLTKGISLAGGDEISRAQAAQLFVNALNADKAGGGKLKTLGSETVLRSVDVAKGKLKTADGKEYDMVKPMTVETLVGVRGKAVLNAEGKLLTFLPVTNTTGKSVSDGAIIVRRNGSTEGFNELTGDATNYAIYRNGKQIAYGALRENDVATYDAANNRILVCDTRVAVYYEKCTPSPAAPTSITVLNTEFAVVPSAQQSLSRFKPGDNMTVLLTADGRIAGAVANDSGVSANAYAYVDGSGKVSLICGGALLALGCTDTAHAGKVGRISQSKQPLADARIGIAVTTGGVGGTLDVAARRLGTLSLADNVMIISKGEILSLNELTEQTVSANRITNAHLNDSGVVDIIVIGDEVTVRGEIYGRVEVTGNLQITLNCGANGKESGRYILSDRTNTIKQGDFVAAIYNNNGLFHPIEPLTKFENVPASAWIGKTIVVAGGATYTVPESVICWNKDLSVWFADFDTAFDYGGVRNLYVKDGVVRVIEISAR